MTMSEGKELYFQRFSQCVDDLMKRLMDFINTLLQQSC